MSKLITGLLAGVAIGILLAPDKGANTRKKIVEGFNDFLEDVEDKVNSAADKVTETANKLKVDVDEERVTMNGTL